MSVSNWVGEGDEFDGDQQLQKVTARMLVSKNANINPFVELIQPPVEPT